jgi:hypothetical protein
VTSVLGVEYESRLRNAFTAGASCRKYLVPTVDLGTGSTACLKTYTRGHPRGRFNLPAFSAFHQVCRRISPCKAEVCLMNAPVMPVRVTVPRHSVKAD